MFYHDKENGFYLEKVNNTLVRSVFKRILKGRIIKDDDKVFVKCRFVLRKAAYISVGIIAMMMLLSVIGILKLITDFSTDMLIAVGIFFVISAVMIVAMCCGRLMFSKEENETIEFLKERISKSKEK